MVKNIGMYLRCSTAKQELDVQRDKISKYIAYTFKPSDIKVYEYSDEGISGKDMNRENISRLKDDIVNGTINTVIAVKLDRLSRSLSDLLILFKFFEEQHIDVHLVDDKIDTSTPMGRFFFQLLGAFCEFDRASIIEKLRAGKQYAKEHGTRSGKPMHRPRKEINIRECIELYKKGLSINKLAKLYHVGPSLIKSRLVEKGIIK